MMTQKAFDEYMAAHDMKAPLANAISSAFKAGATDPIQFFAKHFAEQSAGPAPADNELVTREPLEGDGGYEQRIRSTFEEACAEHACYQLAFGGLDSFFRGLEGHVGPQCMVDGSLLKAMEVEHTQATDADVPFQCGRDFTTTSKTEFYFVVDPEEGLRVLDIGAYPPEENRPGNRKPLPPSSLEENMAELNMRLQQLGDNPLLREEMLAGRLFTGPMFTKYQAVLRIFIGIEFLTSKFEELCMGNTYPTTIHAINACILKLSKLTRAQKVYRGICEARLSDSFWTPNEFGVRGGVEYTIMSYTDDRGVAVEYATDPSGTKPGILLEIRMGMLNRGAELSCLSQYPHEHEIIFPPFMALEVLGFRSEGNLLIVDVNCTLPHHVDLKQAARNRVTDLIESHGQEVLRDVVKGKTVSEGKPIELITGQPDKAAKGLYHYMRVSDPFAEDGVEKIVREVASFVEGVRERARSAPKELIDEFSGILPSEGLTPAIVIEKVVEEVQGNLDYILHEKTSEKTYPNGARDQGRGAVTLDYFLQHENARLAGLVKAQVVGLRLYTTAAFK